MRDISPAAIEQYRKSAKNNANIPVEVLKVKINCLIDASQHITKDADQTVYRFGKCKITVDENNRIIGITWDYDAPGPVYEETKQLLELNKTRGLNRHGSKFIISKRERNYQLDDKEIEHLTSVLFSARRRNKRILQYYFKHLSTATRLKIIHKLLDRRNEEYYDKMLEALCCNLPNDVLTSFILSGMERNKDKIKAYVELDKLIHSLLESGDKKAAASLIDWLQQSDAGT